MKSASKKKTATKRRARVKEPAHARSASRAKPKSRAKKSTPAADVAMGSSVAEMAPAPDIEAIEVSTPAAGPSSVSAATRRAGLKLEASFTLRDATDMLFQLLAVDFGDADVLVDGGAVERIDTAGLQMLIAFAKHHTARGKTLHWTAVSPELLRSSQLLGVTEPLYLTAHLNEGVPGGH
jgi:phospholipid transport system transporter-binding protein